MPTIGVHLEPELTTTLFLFFSCSYGKNTSSGRSGSKLLCASRCASSSVATSICSQVFSKRKKRLLNRARLSQASNVSVVALELAAQLFAQRLAVLSLFPGQRKGIAVCILV